MNRDELNGIALDPSRHVVVEACAGSGKTWLLVPRILRLLLAGAAPSGDPGHHLHPQGGAGGSRPCARGCACSRSNRTTRSARSSPRDRCRQPRSKRCKTRAPPVRALSHRRAGGDRQHLPRLVPRGARAGAARRGRARQCRVDRERPASSATPGTNSPRACAATKRASSPRASATCSSAMMFSPCASFSPVFSASVPAGGHTLRVARIRSRSRSRSCSDISAWTSTPTRSR